MFEGDKEKKKHKTKLIGAWLHVDILTQQPSGS